MVFTKQNWRITMPAFKLFGEDGILLKITSSIRLAERFQKLNEGSTIEEWKPGEIAQAKKEKWEESRKK